MLGFAAADDRRPQKNMPEMIFRCTVSAILGIFTHLALLSIPYFFGAFPLFFQIIFSVAVLLMAVIVGQLVRGFFGVRASAPAFLIFHMIFIWFAYMIIIARTAAFSPLTNILFNVIYAFVLNGFFRMLFRDPGILDNSTEEELKPKPRVTEINQATYVSMTGYSSMKNLAGGKGIEGLTPPLKSPI